VSARALAGRVADRLRADPVARWGTVLFIAVYLGLEYLSNVSILARIARGGTSVPAYTTPLSWTVVDTLFWIVQGVAAFRVAARFPLEGPGRARVGTLVLAVTGCTLGMVVVGQVLYFLMTLQLHELVALFALRDTPATLLKVVSLLLVAYGIGYARQHRAREIAASRLETELSEARLAALKAQLHPHFLFNAFNSVSALLGRDPAAAREMLARLESLLTLTLERAEAQEVTLAEELRVVEMYAGIEGVRFSDRLSVEVDVDPGLHDVLVPHLVLQPLVENAVKHGIAARPGPGRIAVSARADGGRVVLSVADDGPGTSAESASRGEGIGLANTRARLAQLYGAAAALSVESAAGRGTRVTVTLPLRHAPRAPDAAPAPAWASAPSFATGD
jgi:two-component system, LytTR family, sensor kinase